jgi:hypothetical protein
MIGHYLKYILSTAMGLFSSNSSLIEWLIISPSASLTVESIIG